jgi:hypothetical protein
MATHYAVGEREREVIRSIRIPRAMSGTTSFYSFWVLHYHLLWTAAAYDIGGW